MKIKDLELGIVSYCETKIAPKITSSFDKFLFYAGLATFGIKAEKFIQLVAPTAIQLGILDVDGNVDLDLIEKVGTIAFEKQPMVQKWIFTFKQDDFADFMRHLRGQTSPEVKP